MNPIDVFNSFVANVVYLVSGIESELEKVRAVCMYVSKLPLDKRDQNVVAIQIISKALKIQPSNDVLNTLAKFFPFFPSDQQGLSRIVRLG